MARVRSGALRQRAEIQKVTTAANATGEQIATWALESRRWASIEPLSGRELFYAQQVTPTATHRIRMRYFAGLTTARRIRFVASPTATARVFGIGSVLNKDERNREYELLCTEAL